MRTNILSFPINLQYKLEQFGPLDKILFFDIETTGFSSNTSSVYLIGCVFYEKESDTFRSMQWFSEQKQEEALLIHSFFEYANAFDVLIHYNGQGFDIPFIEKKCLTYNLPYRFSRFTSLDLYREISPFKKFLKLPHLKQKSVEDFLEIEREDPFTGGELISVYQSYLLQPSEEAYGSLIQHNLDDLRCMVKILPILSYADLFRGKFHVSQLTLPRSLDVSTPAEYSSDSVFPSSSVKEEPEKELILELTPDTPLPKRISFGNQEFYFTAFQQKCRIKIKLYTGELKYFYPNYRDYYYLPEEDTSIHKSVAFYVDKDFRTQAKAANCYSKKTGCFLPQYEEIVSPYFKREYKDKKTYFEMTEEFSANRELIRTYVLHIFSILAKEK